MYEWGIIALFMGLNVISPPVYPRATIEPRTRIPILGANSNVVPGNIVKVTPGITVMSDKTMYAFSCGVIIMDSEILPPNTPFEVRKISSHVVYIRFKRYCNLI